jgi:LysR family nitrogen assimilation transcriptional regulator
MKAPLELVSATPGLSLGGSARRSLDLRELRYFHCVAKAGNFGRAARELKLDIPALTQQLEKLEGKVGARLFIRHRRGVTLTPAGSSLMERLDVIFGLLNVPLQQAQTPEQTVGSVAVALPPELAPFLAPRILEACLARWPNVTLAIREGSSASLEEWALGRQVDIALLQDPPLFDELEVESVAVERLGLVSGIRTPDDINAIRVRELAGLKLILPNARHWTRRLVEGAAFRRGIVLDQVLQVEGVALAKEMVRNGLGHTILPLIAVRDEVARGTLAFRPIEQDTLMTVHAIACRSGVAPAPFIAEVKGLLRGVISDLASTGGWIGATRTGISGKATEAAVEDTIG